MVFFSFSTAAWAQSCSNLVFNGSANGAAAVITQTNSMVEHMPVPNTGDWNQPKTAQDGHMNNSQVDGFGALVAQVVPQAVASLGGINGLLTGLLGAVTGGGQQGGKFSAGQSNKGCDVVQGCKSPTNGCPATSPQTSDWTQHGEPS